jgi:hypothetical protein
MNLNNASPKHSSSIDFYVETMKVNVSLHLHVRKFKTNLYSNFFNDYFDFKII